MKISMQDFTLRLACAFGLVLAGCGGDDGNAEGASGASEGSDGSGNPETGNDGESGTGASGSDTGTGEPKPDGERCDADAECMSQKCFLAGPLGGVCGECLSDADCTGGGCSIPNPISNPPEGATCNQGEEGEGCMSDDVCSGELKCVEILNVPTVIMASTCSQCAVDADCGTQLCSPGYNVSELSGSWTCVDPGSVADGQGCNIMGTGDDACAGFCGTASVMGLLMLGVCGPCDPETNEGCAEGETCQAPEVNIDDGTLVPAMCMAGA